MINLLGRKGRRRHVGRQTCECGGRLGCRARVLPPRSRFCRRPGHDLCKRCYRTALDMFMARHGIRR